MLIDRFFEKKQEPLVGVDISSTAVKVLQLSQQQDKSYRVEGYAIEPLPQNAVIEKNIKDVDTVGAVLRRALERGQITAKHAAIAVAGTAVITRVLQINKNLNEVELQDQVMVEADRYIPYPIDDVYLDYEIQGTYRGNPDMVDVLLGAAKHEVVDLRIAALQAANLKTEIVDIESLTMERVFGLLSHQLSKDLKKENIALVDLGSTTTTLYILNNQNLIYSRDQNFGGKQLVEEIQRRYGLSLEEIAANNIYEGLPDDFILEVLQPFKETIVQQINRALQFFFSSGEHNDISLMMLAGGVSAIVGLDELIQQKIGKKTFIANPFTDMAIAPNLNEAALQRDAASLLVCCGLALRSFSESH